VAADAVVAAGVRFIAVEAEAETTSLRLKQRPRRRRSACSSGDNRFRGGPSCRGCAAVAGGAGRVSRGCFGAGAGSRARGAPQPAGGGSRASSICST